MVLADIINRVQQVYSKGVMSQSSRLRSRRIYSAIRTATSFLLEDKLKKRKHELSDIYYVNLPCIEMIPAAIHECPCVPAKGCMIYRTKYKFPKRMSILGREYIQYIMTLDGGKNISMTTFDRVRVKYINPYTVNLLEAYFKGDYLYVTGGDVPPVLTSSFIPEDVVEAWNYPNYCNKNETECVDVMQLDYPIEDSLIGPIIEMAVNELLGKREEDNIANAKDDTK